jgi:hypothetical protein
MTLFKNKYSIESARHPYWHYGYDSAYFITICTKDRIPYFGKIMHGKICYSPIGAIAHAMWYEIKNHAKNVKFGEFVVMPDHIIRNQFAFDNISQYILDNPKNWSKKDR